MRYNTLKELQNVVNILWEIDDILNGEASAAVREAIQAVQKAWNVVKKEKGINNSYIPIKSMAAVSRANRMDFNSLRNLAGMYLDREGIKFYETNNGLHVNQFGDIVINAEPAGKTNRSQGRYSIELIADVETGDTFALFENAENDYYEGDSTSGFQEDMEDIVREIFALGRDNVPFIAKDMAADYETDDIDTGYQFMLDAYPEFKVFM